MLEDLEIRETQKQTEKKKKPLLVIGSILLGVALLIGAGYFSTGSLLLARNAIAVLLLGGTGAGLGGVALKLVGKIKNKLSNKGTSINLSRNRGLGKNLNKEMETLPENKQNIEKDKNTIFGDWESETKSVSSQQDKDQKKSR